MVVVVVVHHVHNSEISSSNVPQAGWLKFLACGFQSFLMHFVVAVMIHPNYKMLLTLIWQQDATLNYSQVF